MAFDDPIYNIVYKSSIVYKCWTGIDMDIALWLFKYWLYKYNLRCIYVLADSIL